MTTMNDRVLRAFLGHKQARWPVSCSCQAFCWFLRLLGCRFLNVGTFELTQPSPSRASCLFSTSRIDVRCGELIEFNAPANPYIASKYVLGKRVVGMPGDVVEFRGRDVLINGEFVHTAKKVSLRGDRLDLLRDGKAFVIDTGYYYVAGEHKDSFDSRYSIFGLIPQSAVIGTGRSVF